MRASREQQERFDASADDLMQQQIQVARIFSFLFPVIFLIANLGQAAVLYFGGAQIINGTLTLGEWQKFSLYLIFVFFPLGQLGFIIIADGAGQRVGAAASSRSWTRRATWPTSRARSTLPPVEGRVEFEDVTFRYFGGGEPVLTGRQLRRRAGPDGRAAGRDRQRQEHHHQPDPALLRRHRRAASRSTGTMCAT